MDLLLWLTISFVMIGFVGLASMKKSMESRLAALTTENMTEEESSLKVKSIIWWIVSITAWGILSMTLIVWWFYNNFG